MADDGGFYGLIAKIQEQYPAAIPLLKQPGVLKVYADAIAGGWSSDRVEAALEQTEWWQKSPASVRQFQALQATDPATAAQKAADTKRIFDDLQRQLGIQVDTTGGFNSPSFQLFTKAVTEGWDATRIKYELASTVNGKQAGGAIGKSATDVKKMADDYAVPLSDNAVMSYAKQLESGAIDQNGIQGYLTEQAKSLFPTLGAALDKGITVRQFMDPYLQLAQQELNVNPQDITLTDGKWLKLINTVDPKTQQRQPMTLDQALTTFRTDPSFGYDATDKAKQDATQLAAALQTKFGNA